MRSDEKYETQRNARIDEYLRAVGANAELDVLFISHIHFDHISGIERLLDKTNGLTVDTIVMPLINVADRLFAYARAANEDPAAINDQFFRELVANPRMRWDGWGRDSFSLLDVDHQMAELWAQEGKMTMIRRGQRTFLLCGEANALGAFIGN